MRKAILKTFSIVVLLTGTSLLNAQNLKVWDSRYYPLDKIVREYLFGGNKNVTIKNIKMTRGVYDQVGAYDATGTSFGTTTGLMLSTGSVFKAMGPFAFDTMSYQWTTTPDPDAEIIANGGVPVPPPMGGPPPAPLTADPAVVEFDITTPGTGFTFNFQFGSDEYRDSLYTDTTQDMPRDIFGILVQGKGLGDGINYVNLGTVTVIRPAPDPPPDTGWGPFEMPVNTYTVNNGPHGTGPCMNCENYMENVNGKNYPYTMMPGFTTVFTKSFNVIPCDTYHVKLLIADRGSQLIDSHVFMNVDVINPPLYQVVDRVQIGSTSYPVDTVAFEECDYAEIRIERYTNIGTSGYYDISYGGTAVAGVDYTPLPTHITFAPNQRVAILRLEAKKTAPGTPDRSIIVYSSNEICGVKKYYQKLYMIRKDLMNFNLGPDTSLCEGLKYTLNATNTPGAEYYVWNDSTSGAIKTVTQTGKYSVRVRIGTCMKSDTASVYFKPLVKFSLGPDSSICFKDSLKLDPKLSLADTAIHYKWYDNTIKPTKTVGSTGTYWLQVTKNGCTNADTMQLTVKPLPTINIGPDTTFCYATNPSYTLIATTDPSNTVLWNTGSTNLSIKATQTGLYWIKVKGNGCFNYDTAAVNMLLIPPVNIKDTLICDNYPLKLKAPAGYTYQWSTGSTNSEINVLNQYTYSVIVRNGICAAYDTAKVTYKPSPKVDLGKDSALCKGQSVILDATYTGDDVRYYWGGAGSGCQFMSSCATTSSGYYVVTLVSNTNGCITKDSMYFTAKPLPPINLGKDTFICFDQPVTIQPNCLYDSVYWFDGSKGPNYTYNKPGNYWVKAWYNNCSNLDTIHVKLSPNAPTFTMPNDTGFCKGKNVYYDVSCVGCTYLWDDNTTAPIKTFKDSGKFSVAITKDNCKRIEDINVTAVVPASVFPNDTFVCTGKTLILTNPIAGSKSKWYDNTIVNSKIINGPGKYWLTITRLGCTYSDTVNVEFGGGPSVDLGADVSTCSLDPIVLNAYNKGNATYLWNTGATTPTLPIDSGGTYKVEVTRCGITESDEVYIDYMSKSMVMYIPNAFTPDNNDNINDMLLAGGQVKQLKTFSMTIYNNWGQKVFESTDPTKGWDGTYNGDKLPGGVYLYNIDASSDCYVDPYFHKSGNVTLLR